MPDHVTTFADLDGPHEAEELDFYETPSTVTEALLRAEPFHGVILEPCAGNGAIVRVLRRHAHSVIAKDIVQRQAMLDEVVPFQFDGQTYDNIITNPPFTYINDFIEDAVSRAERKAAILAPLTVLTSLERYSIFKRKRPVRVHVIFERFGWIIGDVEHKSHYTNYCWLIWEKDVPAQRTELRWMKL